jgi:alpha-beta hydrolase superfamily lysophospholipase
MEKPIIINAKECKECNVPKGWGHEIIFESDSYRVYRKWLDNKNI